MLTDEKINEIFDLDPNIKQGDWKGYKRAALVMAPRAIEQAVREEMAKQEPVAFLLNGSRFKLSFQSICCEACGAEHDRVSCEPLGMYANELQGAWVALVPAENDRHIRMVAPVVPDLIVLDPATGGVRPFVPPDMVMVPREPSEAMIEAARRAAGPSTATYTYKAMIAAAEKRNAG
jgi:hypothetical protein